MPGLGEKDIDSLIKGTVERTGKDLTDPDVFRQLNQIFVDEVSLLSEARQNQDILRTARQRNINQNREENINLLTDRNTSSAFARNLIVGELGNLVARNSRKTREEALEQIALEVNAEFEGRLQDPFSSAFQSTQEVLRNLPVLGRLIDWSIEQDTGLPAEKMIELRQLARETAKKESLVGARGAVTSLAEGAGQLAGFVAAAQPFGGLGLGAKGVIGTIGRSAVPFAGAAALTTPGGIQERGQAALIGGATGAVLGAISIPLQKLTGKFAGRFIPSVFEKTGSAQFARVMAERFAPASVRVAADSFILTSIEKFQQEIIHPDHDFDFSTRYWENLALFGMFHGVGAGAQGLRSMRKRRQGFVVPDVSRFRQRVTREKVIAGFEVIGPGRGRAKARELIKDGFDPFEINLARSAAERGISIDANRAAEIKSSPDLTQSMLASESSLLLMPTRLYKRVLDQQIKEGKIDPKLLDPAGFIEALGEFRTEPVPDLSKLPLAEMRKTFFQKDVLIAKRDSLLRQSERAGRAAFNQAGRSPLAAAKFSNLAVKLKQQAMELQQAAEAQTGQQPPATKTKLSYKHHSPTEALDIMFRAMSLRKALRTSSKETINLAREQMSLPPLEAPNAVELEGMKAYLSEVINAHRRNVFPQAETKATIGNLTSLHGYLREMRNWITSGKRGEAPKYPEKLGGNALQAHMTATRLLEPQIDSIEDVSAGILGANTEMARMLRSLHPEEVQTAVQEARETSTSIPFTKELARQIPPLPEARDVVQALDQRADLIRKDMNENTPEFNTALSAANGGLEMLPARLLDRTARAEAVIRKTFLGPFGKRFSELFADAGHAHYTYQDSMLRHLEARTAGYQEYLAKLERVGGQEAVDAAWRRLIDLKEGTRNWDRLDPAEVDMLNTLERVYFSVAEGLKMVGEPVVEDGSYVTRLVDGLSKYTKYQNPKDRNRLKDMGSRFLQERTAISVPERMTDLLDVFEIYIPSVSRVLSFRPVRSLWNDVMKHYGVQGEKGQLAPKKDRQPIPASTANWFNRRFDLIQGVPGQISRALERGADVVVSGVERALNRKLPTGGRGMIRGFMVLNHVLALGLRASSAVKNVVGGSIAAIAEVGPVNFVRGLRQTLHRNPDTGLVRFNPAIKELGFMDSSFQRTIQEHLNKNLKGKLRALTDEMQDTMMGLFGPSETFIRGGTGLAAYRKAKQSGLSEIDARRHAREIASATQADYDSIFGGEIFAGSAGKFIGQFQRFGTNKLNYLTGIVQRSGLLGNRQALIGEAKVPLLPGESGLAKLLMFGLSAYTPVFMFRQLFGVHMNDVNGPLSDLPELIKQPLATATERTVALLSGENVGRVFTGNITPESRRAALGFEDLFGYRTQSPNIIAAAMDSIGPGPAQLLTPLDIMLDRSPSSDVGLRSGLRDWRLITGGGLAVDAFRRFMQESRDGFIRSRSSGVRIAPSEGRALTASERWLRLFGFTPTTIEEEYRNLDDLKFIEDRWSVDVSNLRQDAKDQLREGADARDVRDLFVGGMGILEEEYGTFLTMKQIRARWNQLVRELEESEAETVGERISSRTPFTSPTR